MLRCLKLVSVLSVLALAGCTYVYGDKGVIQNRDKDYIKAQSVPPLKIPPGLSSSTIESHYPVSERYYPDSAKIVSLTPPDLVVIPELKITPTPLTTNAPEGAATMLPTQVPTPNYYYDPYTRTAGAGHSVGSLFSGLSWGKKKPADQSTAASGTASTTTSKPLDKNSNNPDNGTGNAQNTATPDAQGNNTETGYNSIKKDNYYFDQYSRR